MIPATYFDGRTARANPVRIAVHGNALVIADERAVLRRAPLEQLRVAAPAGSAPRRLELADGGLLEVTDHAALAALLKEAGIDDRGSRGVGRGVAVMLGCVAAGLVALVLLVRWLVPLASGSVVTMLPPALDRQLGEQAWPALEQASLAPSRLPAERQQALQARFAALAASAPAIGYDVVFRGGSLGPNALALPGGRIVFTDALVELSRDDDALVGVFAHELGHVAHRHAMRSLVQNAALSTLLALWLGDLSSILVGLPTTLATLEYSRDLEREADGFAIARLADAGIPTAAFADLLERLAASAPAGSPSGLWSTHPVTRERVQRLRDAVPPAGDGKIGRPP